MKTLKEEGYDALFAGGCVRDMVRGVVPKDVDIATSARPEEISALFRHTIGVGEAFGVMIVRLRGHNFEVATFRSEGEYVDGRHPSSVSYVSAEEDVRRRDFTVNALLYDPVKEELIDHIEGLSDLSRRVIRSVGSPAQRFEEDHLRVLRAIRFSAQLDFEIEDLTWQAVKDKAFKISTVSWERVREEIFRLLSCEGKTRGVELLLSSGLLGHILPEITHAEARPLLLSVIPCLSHLPDPIPEQGLALLLTALDVSPLSLQPLLDRLRLSAKEAKRVIGCVEGVRQIPDLPQQVLCLRKRIYRAPHFADAMAVYRARVLEKGIGLEVWERISAEMSGMREEDLWPPKLITGNDLIVMGWKEGKRVGEILKALEDEQLEGRIKDKDAAVCWVRKNYA